MPAEFGIIYQAIFRSSLMDQPVEIRYVWDCMLVLSGSTPFVRMGPRAIAHETHLPLDLVQTALRVFLSPDPESTTRDHEGRRLELIEEGNERAGYRILNKEIWKSRSAEDRKIARRSADTARKRIKRAAAKESPETDLDKSRKRFERTRVSELRRVAYAQKMQGDKE